MQQPGAVLVLLRVPRLSGVGSTWVVASQVTLAATKVELDTTKTLMKMDVDALTEVTLSA
jgi:hypothetical protein